jgi:hypothetical protein
VLNGLNLSSCIILLQPGTPNFPLPHIGDKGVGSPRPPMSVEAMVEAHSDYKLLIKKEKILIQLTTVLI